MSDSQLPKTYNPTEHEEKVYKMWEESGAFDPDSSFLVTGSLVTGKKTRKPATSRQKTSFSIIMPPPNANGALHIGHAVGITLQDLMVRYHRMKGDDTLWLPGADHAGFETQVVFEKYLEKKGQSRFDFDRETLYQEMLDFTLKNKSVMENQLRRLGASCDWSREKFTLDPAIVQIIYATFKQLYDDGLAYKAEGIVNWCLKHQTSLSGLEVKYIEQQDPLYYLRYGPFVIATARPETKFGDKYVVVHPDDQRYQQFRSGQKFAVDWINGQVTATLIKDSMIDMSFGSGAMTITPWHDAADFALAKKHHLDMEQIIDFGGRLKDIAGPLAGLKVKPARTELIKILQDKGLVAKIDENYQHSVAVCYKCQTPIEPQVRMQWWLKMTENSKFEIRNSKITKQLGQTYSLRDVGEAAVKSGEVKFVTKKFEKIFLHWLKILEDWNLSRQIVWGIQLPVWYCRGCDHTLVDVPKEVIVYAVRHGQAEHNVGGILNGDPLRTSNLTEQGREEVERLAKKLKGVKFDHIFVSAMPRTKQTAVIIQDVILDQNPRLNREAADRGSGDEIPASAGLTRNMADIPITVDQRLNDIWVGELEGQSIDNVRQKTDNYTQSVGGSETMADIAWRSQAFFDELLEKYSDQTVLVVSSEILLHCLYESPQSGICEETGADHPETGSYRRLVFRYPNKCPKCDGRLQRDLDVFDTWFSSGQWPFATLLSHSGSNLKLKTKNSKLNKDDFERFYPTTVMETGWDILFFWVARMIMLGLYKTGEVPFRYIYLHGLVRDKDRQKMSKSKGNVIDPLGVADLYGADAVRLALVFGAAAGNDMAISEEKIRGMRNFANKVWNIGRFVIGHASILTSEGVKPERPNQAEHSEAGLTVPPSAGRPNLLTDVDRNIWSKLNETIKVVTNHIDHFRFHQAAGVLYDFIWHEYADQYIEEAKKQLEDPKLRDNTSQLLVFSFKLLVKSLHPFMPFVTEAMWQGLRRHKLVDESLLVSARWPKISSPDG